MGARTRGEEIRIAIQMKCLNRLERERAAAQNLQFGVQLLAVVFISTQSLNLFQAELGGNVGSHLKISLRGIQLGLNMIECMPTSKPTTAATPISQPRFFRNWMKRPMGSASALMPGTTMSALSGIGSEP